MKHARASGPGAFLLPAPLGLLLIGAAPAQSGSWTVRTIAGTALQGEVAVSPDGAVKVTAGDAVTRLETGDLLSLQQGGVTERQAPPGHRLWLRSGSDLPFTAAAVVPGEAGGSAGLRVDSGLGSTITFGLAHLAAIRFHRPGAETATFEAERRNPAESNDYLFMLREGNVQRFGGVISGLEDGKIAFELRGQTRHVALDDVVAIVFGRVTGFAPNAQAGPRATLHLDTGDRLMGKLVTLDSDALVHFDEGVDLKVPRARVREIAMVSDRLAWLSDLTPTVEQTSAFDRVWPWTVNRSPAGGQIRLGGLVRERGLVLVPRIRLTYDLQGKYDAFAATIGIEDRGGPQANAVLRVLADGKLLHESLGVTCGRAPVDLELPLDKARHLTIEADFGKNYDLGDLCVFADARVFKR